MNTQESATQTVLMHLRDVEHRMNDFGSALPSANERTTHQLVIARVDEYDIGWVFFYNSKEYVETGNFLYALAGNGPLIVDRVDGKLYATGSGQPVEFFIEEFRKGNRRPALT